MADTKEKKMSMDELVEKISRGKMILAQPIKAHGKEIKELEFDFRKLTGIEYANAMSVEPSKNIFELTTKQAISLFAAAAAKMNEDADAHDIYEQMGIDDAIKAGQQATLFFNASQRGEYARITRD